MRLRRTGILTKVVIVVLLVYLATSLLDLRGQIQNTKEQQQTVSQQVEDQRLANQELQEAIDNSDDPETLERVARERGYVKQGETLYSDVAGRDADVRAEVRASARPTHSFRGKFTRRIFQSVWSSVLVRFWKVK